MTISYIGAGGAQSQTGDIASALLAPTRAVDDLLILGTILKAAAPVSAVHNTPTGFTNQGFEQTGTVGTVGSGGSTKVQCFTRTATNNSSDTPTVGYSDSSVNPGGRRMVAIRKTAPGSWITETLTGVDPDSTGTTFDFDANGPFSDLRVGDWVIVALSSNDNAAHDFTSVDITIPNVTLTSTTIRISDGISTGNDACLGIATAEVTALGGTPGTPSVSGSVIKVNHSDVAGILLRASEFPAAIPNSLETSIEISQPSIFIQYDGVQFAAENDVTGTSLTLDPLGAVSGQSRFLVAFAAVELQEKNWTGCTANDVSGASVTIVEQAESPGQSIEAFYWFDTQLPPTAENISIALTGVPAGTALHTALFVGAKQVTPDFDTESLTQAEHIAQSNEVRWTLTTVDPNAALIACATYGASGGTIVGNGLGTLIGTSGHSGGQTATSYDIKVTPNTYNELQDFSSGSRAAGIGLVIERAELGAQPHSLVTTVEISKPTLFQTHIVQPSALVVDIDVIEPDIVPKVAAYPLVLETEITISSPFVGSGYVPITTQDLQVVIEISKPTLFQQHYVTVYSLTSEPEISSPGVFTLTTIFGSILMLHDEPRYLSVNDELRYIYVDEESRNIILEI